MEDSDSKYDDLHTYKVSGTVFRVPKLYNPVKVMGKGSYGIVIAAVHKDDSSQKVAIKRIKPMAADEWDARHTLREIRIMRLLGDHPNIISLLNVRALVDSNELYITMEFMDTDLHQIIRSKQDLSEQHCKYLLLQLLNGLRAMHYYNILHRDLKPGNLLVNRECQLRITDFGLSRYATLSNQSPDGPEPKEKLTEYVVTRWYRCPELLLSPAQNYSCAVDLWSVGCIFAELILRKPLMAGKNYVHQVQLILDIFGTPDSFGFELTDDARSYMASQPFHPPMDLAQILPSMSENALDLFRKLTTYSPTERITAHDATQHRFFWDAPAVAGWKPKYENAEQVDLAFDSHKHTLAELKQLIIEEDHVFNQPKEDESTDALQESMVSEIPDLQNPTNAQEQESGEQSSNSVIGEGQEMRKLKQPSQQHEVTADEQTAHHLDQKKTMHNQSLQGLMAMQQKADEEQQAPCPDSTENNPESEGEEEVQAVTDDPLCTSNVAAAMENISLETRLRASSNSSQNQNLKDILKPYNPTVEKELPVAKQKLYNALVTGKALKTSPETPPPDETYRSFKPA